MEMTIESIFGEKAMKESDQNVFVPVKTEKISVMTWGCITYSGVGTLTKVDGTINATEYVDTLDSCL